MSEQVITSLAILKVNWDRGHDYIENFIPFVAECLRMAPHAEVSLPELQAALTEAFGLRIPQGALKTVLKRAVEHNYVKRTQKMYFRNDDALATLDFATVRADVLRRYEALIRKFVEFCKTQYHISWLKKEAEAAFLIYLQDRSTPILAAAVEGESIPAPARPMRKAEFLANAFIMHLCKNDPEGFEFLDTIVKGNMLANVLFFPDLGGVSQRFGQAEVYFDTPFLLRALGLAGPSMEISCRELMDLLYELNGALRCFEHTVEEIQGILDVAAHALRDRTYLRDAYGETLEYFIDSNYRASDVELIIARLGQLLRALRVQVRPKPPYEELIGIDESKLEVILQEEVGYHRGETLRRDLDSLTAIHCLRRGQFSQRIESCNAIFITTNFSLARASTRFFREEYGNVGVPHCMLDQVFTTLVWLKKPMRAPDLPRKKTIADCYAALNPSNILWKLYLQEIDRLQKQGNISEEDYFLLRFSTEARNLLMDITLGESDAFTEGTVREILDKARAVVRAETEAALRAERKKRVEAERKAADAEAHVEVQRQAQLDRFQSIGARGGSWIARIVLGTGIMILCLGVCFTSFQPFPKLPKELLKLVARGILIILTVFTIANLSFGTTLRSLARRIEVSASRFIERVLIRIAKP